MDAIASRVDLTVPALYRHFEDKADLLMAAIEQALSRLWTAHYEEEVTSLTSEVIPEHVAKYALPDGRQLFRLVIEIHAGATRDKGVAKVLSRFNSGARNFLAQGLRSGPLPDDLDAVRSADLLNVIMMGLMHIETLAPERLRDPQWPGFVAGAVERLLGVRQDEEEVPELADAKERRNHG
jgi:AcrR family transcriptional regulator